MSQTVCYNQSMTKKKESMDSPKKRTRPDPVSLYPLDFEEALRGILEAGPHVEPDDKATQNEQKKERGNKKGE